jgi:putative transposase
MCRVLGVSTSGYYAWRGRGPSARALADQQLTAEICEIHANSRGTYGSPRIHAELRLGRRQRCSRKRVARLMRDAKLAGIHRRRLIGTTRRNPEHEPFPDLVQRQFTVTSPDRIWVNDMTQHPTAEGWLYLVVVIDAFSRMVVGWAMGDRPTTELVLRSVTMAVRKRRPPVGLIHHSDHGSQYTSLAFGQHLISAGVTGSMGRVGDALDNAVAESFFATLQTELLDRRAWPTRAGLTAAIFEFIEGFYNRQRRHSTLGYLSPSDFEQDWYQQHEGQAAD